MKRKGIIALLLLGLLHHLYGQIQVSTVKPEQTIFAFGGDIDPKFVQYVVDLTGKPHPKVCYVPTASADNVDNIKYWEFICKKLSIQPYILKVWIDSAHAPDTFEEILLGMDAIVVGGGNTLNMLGIWKAQGIDNILRKALERGIILSGGSAGSICWFQNGVSDSRPVSLSLVDGMAFLPYSNCPHYSDSLRKTMYHQQVESEKMKAGYACDDLSGILFKNGKFVEAVSQNDVNDSYYITLEKGIARSRKLDSKMLINKNAISVDAYTMTASGKRLKDFIEMNEQNTPLHAFVSLMYIFANGQMSKHKQMASHYLQSRLDDAATDLVVEEAKKNRFLNAKIDRVLIYNDSVAGVVTKMYDDFYSIWYFYNENGRWLSAGEDVGGQTAYEAEISFRENADIHLDKVRKIVSES